MTSTVPSLALVLAPALLLAGCGDKAKAPEHKAASGTILGGEVSDSMIPLDSVRSTSPADPRGDRLADTGTAAPAASGGAAAPASPEPAANTTPPASSPTPQAS